MSDILAAADVPAGSLYHQFQGKRDLALAVIEERVAPAVRDTWIAPLEAGDDAERAIRAVFDDTASSIERRRGKTTGCPITNLAVELALSDRELRAALDAVFNEWENAVRARLARRDPSGALSTLIVASFSGAMTLAKTTQSARPLRDCAAMIGSLFTRDS